MSNEAERQFFNITPPKQSTEPGVGVTWLATTTTATAHDLTASSHRNMFGKLLTFQASGGKIWLGWGPAATPLISKATAAGATIAAGTLEAAPISIADGESITFRLTRGDHSFLHVQADSGTPTLIIYPTAQQALKDVRQPDMT